MIGELFTQTTHTLWRSTCAFCASPGYTRHFDRTSVYLCADARCITSQYRMTFIFLSVSLFNDLVDPVFMVWIGGFQEQVQCLFVGLVALSFFCLQLFSLSLLFLCTLVVWGWGLRTDRMSISLSRPCIANLFLK